MWWRKSSRNYWYFLKGTEIDEVGLYKLSALEKLFQVVLLTKLKAKFDENLWFIYLHGIRGIDLSLTEPKQPIWSTGFEVFGMCSLVNQRTINEIRKKSNLMRQKKLLFVRARTNHKIDKGRRKVKRRALGTLIILIESARIIEHVD